MNDDKKKPSGEIVIRGGFAAKAENFWYHYKWIVIGVAIMVIIVLICTLQTCSTEKKDTAVVYAGPVYLSSSETEQLRTVMNEILPSDFDGNGKKYVQLSMYEIYSEEQIRAKEAEGEAGYVDKNRNSSQYQTYSTYQQTGDANIFFLDPWLYQSLDKAYLCPLSEVTEGIPEGALDDGYGVRLGDTALWRENAAVRLLPEDTVICMMVNLYNPIGKQTKNEKEFQHEKEMFCALVTYAGKENGGES